MRPIVQSVFEAKLNLRLAEPVDVAQTGFDLAAQLATDAVEMAGDGCFVLAEQAANLSQRKIPGVIRGEAQEIARGQRSKSLQQGILKKREIKSTVGVWVGLARRTVQATTISRFGLFFKRLETPGGAQGVDVSLSEDGAEPGGKLAAPVEITEEGAARSGGIGEAVEFGVERVGEFASAGFMHAVRARGANDGAGGCVEVFAKVAEEVLPSRLTAFGTGASEGQIRNLQGIQIGG